MTDIINTPARLREFLLDNPTLATAVSNRIWANKLPDDEFEHMPRDGVLLKPGSAIAEISIPKYTERSDIYCYGSTPRAAWQIYRKLFNALHRVGLQTVDTDKRIMQAYQVGGPAPMSEKEFGWPFVWVAFNVIWLETAVT